ncbi:MAG: threonine dehydrogenase-like Zn-dependent dehydrogenase [Halioglobus sp.]|jgi:threonine dehydrogenase-like Zn-dependent dehydrogenase
MKAIQVIDSKPHFLELPEPKGNNIRVKVVSASICGSDLHVMPSGMIDGFILGHEFAGTTPDGTAVAVEPVISCGECSPCHDGHRVHCSQTAVIAGITGNGGMAEYVDVPAEALVILPTGLDISTASLVEPLAVAVHGIDRSAIERGDRVLVIGAGPIGLAIAAVLGAKGIAFDIIARHPHQKSIAESFGGVLTATDGYDVVIDAIGNSESLKDAVERVRPMGRVTMVGTFWLPTETPFEFCAKEVELVASMMYNCKSPNRSFDIAAKLLFENPYIANAMVTHRFPLEASDEAFAAAADRSAGSVKVVFDVSEAV